MDPKDARAAWTTPALLSLSISLDTAISTGSGADASSAAYIPPPQ